MSDMNTLRVAVLQVFSDGIEHSSEELQELMKARFSLTSPDLLKKTDRGNSAFRNEVARALANLQGAPNVQLEFIQKVIEKEFVYKITNLGESLLRLNPQSLTIKDLKSFSPRPISR